MTAPARLREYLAQFPGRCRDCGWHEPSQGHAPSCERGVVAARKAMKSTTQAHPEDAAAVDRVLEAFIRLGRDFTLNDMRPHLRHVAVRNVIGSRVNAFAQAGRIRDTGSRVRSSDPGTHGHEIRVWRPIR